LISLSHFIGLDIERQRLPALLNSVTRFVLSNFHPQFKSLAASTPTRTRHLDTTIAVSHLLQHLPSPPDLHLHKLTLL
jgi:hypothetical protein